MAQGGKKPQFAAMPKRAISDVRLTDRDFRNLAAIASHDRLSSVRGTGQGAWASHATMAAEVGTEYSRFSVSVNKMLVLGYLARERLGTDRRKFTYRVIYTDEDHLPLGKGSEQPNVVPAANLPDEVLCSSANEAGEIVCSDPELTHSDYIETPPQYISLSEEIDSVETGEIDSVETAHLKVRRLSSKIWIDDNVGARLAMFERAFRADPQAFTDEQLLEQHDWLRSLTEDVNPDDPNYHRASRLYYNLEYYLWESGITSDEEAAA